MSDEKQIVNPVSLLLLLLSLYMYIFGPSSITDNILTHSLSASASVLVLCFDFLPLFSDIWMLYNRNIECYYNRGDGEEGMVWRMWSLSMVMTPQGRPNVCVGFSFSITVNYSKCKLITNFFFIKMVNFYKLTFDVLQLNFILFFYIMLV